jgi:hypothetical protein
VRHWLVYLLPVHCEEEAKQPENFEIVNSELVQLRACEWLHGPRVPSVGNSENRAVYLHRITEQYVKNYEFSLALEVKLLCVPKKKKGIWNSDFF